MADRVAETRAEIERERVALNTTLDRLEAKVHQELDWRARLKQQRPRLIAVGVGVLTVAAAGMIAAKVVRDRRHKTIVSRFKGVASFDDLKAELQNVREELANRGGGKSTDSEPLWSKIALKAAVAGAAAASTYGARQMVNRYGGGEASDLNPGEVAGRAAKAV